VRGKLPRTTAIFVHVQTPDGRRLFGDHDALAGSFLIADAPRERLLRDAFAIHLGPAQAGDYRLYVGLWTVANGKRVPVRVPGRGSADEETRLFVGTFRLIE
jgi:hypothetical protein